MAPIQSVNLYMKAVLLTKIGIANNLLYKSIDIPRAAENEALIKVSYCGINHLDLLIKEGKRPGPKVFPHILGSEIVGIVKSLGNNKTQFKIGDTVTVYPWLFCGKCHQCTTGNENICDNSGTVGRTSWGGYAQYVVVLVQNLVKIPQDLSLEKVCAVTLTGTTAVHLIDRAKIKDNSSVLVTGATGGVGTVVIQLLKHKKCTIFSTTSHDNKKNQLTKLGVDHIVSTENLISEVKQVNPFGVEYVIDLMGASVWSNAIEVLAKNGTLVFCATTLDEFGTVNIGSAFSRQINILGSYGGTIKDLKKVLKLLEKRTIQPVIDSVYLLSKTSEALDKLNKQKVFGKILLEN